MATLNQRASSLLRPLTALSITQKLLIAALGTVAVLALILVASTTGKPQMEELFPNVAGDQLGKVKAYLDRKRIPNRTEGGKLLAPPEYREMAIAELAENNELPGSIKLLFDGLIDKQHWMNTKAQNETIHNTAMQNELSRVIARFEGVKSAWVAIDAPDPMGLGGSFRKPTASVGVTMQPGRALSQSSVNAIAALVAGAKSGMAMTDVRVVDTSTGRQMVPRAPEDFSASDYLETVAKTERYFVEKLRESVSYIPGALVTVSATVDTTRRDIKDTKFHPEGAGSLSSEIKNETTTKKESTGSPQGEVGTRVNVGTSLNDPSGGGVKNDDNTKKKESQVNAGSRTEIIRDARGTPTKIAAIVSVSREYISSLVKISKVAPAPAAAGAAPVAEVEPTQAEIEDKFKTEKVRLESELQSIILAGVVPGADGTVATPDPAFRSLTVSLIPVPLASLQLGPSSSGNSAGILASLSGGSSGGEGLLASGLIRNIFMGGLALGAVGMMLMLVKKASKPVDLPTAESIVGMPPTLEGDSDMVGEAEESEMAIEGLELGDSQIKTKKLLEQVDELVKQNPVEAAALVNNWLDTEE